MLVVSPVTRFAGASGGRMNCPGVTELVVTGVGLQYHMINAPGFMILVLMALATDVVTGLVAAPAAR